MAKRLVVCCDGTWDVPDHIDRGQLRPSNVAKLALAVAPTDPRGREQPVYYHPGVGTGRFDHLRGGAFAWGLSQNIVDAYRFIIDQYEQGDELFLFGFSRGAYTARSLAGLIRNCGVLRRGNRGKVPDAYALYRRRDSASHPAAYESQLFRRMYAWEVRIAFIGVWDTVGSLGIPSGIPWLPISLIQLMNKRWQFHDLRLSSFVDNAYQAIAIDEKRLQFQPALWEQQARTQQHLEQVWFAGVHVNIGGGYEDTGLSDITLDWMIRKAEACGLAVDRTSIPAPFAPNYRGELRNSKDGMYTVFPPYDTIRAMGKGQNANEFAHQSAIDRVQLAPQLSYKPENLSGFLARGGAITS